MTTPPILLSLGPYSFPAPPRYMSGPHDLTDIEATHLNVEIQDRVLNKLKPSFPSGKVLSLQQVMDFLVIVRKTVLTYQLRSNHKHDVMATCQMLEEHKKNFKSRSEDMTEHEALARAIMALASARTDLDQMLA